MAMAYPTLTRRRNPWSDLLSLQEEMNRLFESQMGVPQRTAGLYGTDYIPPVDVLRNKESIVVRADLPGMTKDDIDLTVVNGRLFIRGEKKQEKKDEGTSTHRIERFYGSFERVIDLPNLVDSENIKASFRDGVLEIEAPLRPEAKPRQIAVNVQ
jgi:HSP20 family protein